MERARGTARLSGLCNCASEYGCPRALESTIGQKLKPFYSLIDASKRLLSIRRCAVKSAVDLIPG